jgi:hypothetical protein
MALEKPTAEVERMDPRSRTRFRVGEGGNTKGLFARVAEGSQACPLGPGLDWPGPNGAKHLVCVHVSPESGRVQIVFAAILGAGLEANYLQLPN